MIVGDKMLENINIERELKILFMGTPEFSVPVLEGLIANYKVRAIITQPDRQIGRDQKSIFPPVKKVGMEHTILVIQPEKIREHIEEVLMLEPDLIITCAYGQMIPREILDAPKLGCINVHASLLPKLRGGAPIHRAIIEGHKQTGITIMYMNPKMDEGDIIASEAIDILDTDTASTLHDKLSLLGRDLLLKTLPSIINRTNTRTPQDSAIATYGFIIKREDEKLQFDSTKREVYNHVRGLNSWPGAYCLIDNMVLKVWECRQTDNVFPSYFDGQITAIYPDGIGVKVSNGEIVLTVVQPEGKKRMSATDFANGMANKESIIGKILV